MRKYCFIIPKTPEEFQTPVRKTLWEITVRSLLEQTSKDWLAIVVDDIQKIEGAFHYIKSERNAKTEKILTALEYLETLETKPEYLIRLDDDDVVSPFLLARIKNENFDCYADKTKWYYDIVARKFYINRESWLANTIIQKYQLALTVQKENNLPIIASNHYSFFYKFYSNTKINYSHIFSPLYIRILSPTVRSLKLEFGSEQTAMDLDAYDQLIKRIKDKSWHKLNHVPAPTWWRRYSPYFKTLATESVFV